MIIQLFDFMDDIYGQQAQLVVCSVHKNGEKKWNKMKSLIAR